MELGVRIYFEDETVYIPQSAFTQESDGAFRARVRNVTVCRRFEQAEGGEVVTLTLESESALRVKRADSIVFCVTPKATDRVAVLGRDMYCGMMRYPHELPRGREYGTQAAGHFETLTGKGPIFAGVVPFDRVYASLVYRLENGDILYCAKTEFTEYELNAKKLSAQPVLWCENSTIDDFFTLYRSLLPQSTFDMPKLTGWNSWDYYLNNVTPADVEENAKALSALSFADKLDYIVIDDGWQRAWGDWRENEKFACGLESVARSIREAGFLPGIWMAPFSLNPGSELLAKRPDWFLRDDGGEPILSLGLNYLDPTHPDAAEFMLDAYRYQYRAGFRLFKMDYVAGLLECRRFHDGKSTPYGAIRDFVRRVKAETGPDAVILGCSLPPECGADVAPAMRIGVDTHIYFTHVEWIAETLTWSWMYNGKICRVDPDFLVVRGPDTSKEPVERKEKIYSAPPLPEQTDKEFFKSRWTNGNPFSFVEAETWANLAAISGGDLFLSDRISMLNEKGVSLIENAMKLAGDMVRPRFLDGDRRRASLWLGDRGMLAINWEDVPRVMRLPAPERGFSAAKRYEIKDDTLEITLLPHESFAAIYD